MARAQILVADRDQEFAVGLAANLKSLGYGVTEVVSSPEEALQKAEEKQPDLLLLDLELLRDGKRGKAVRQLQKSFPQGVLYLVADEERKTLRQAKITHSFDYLRKAYDSRELETIIDMALYRRKLEGESKRDREKQRQARQKWQQRDEKQTAKLGKITTALKTETDRHQRLEETLQAERKKLFAVLDTLPAYVVLLTPDYEVPLANREFIKRFGAPEGRKCYDFLFGRTSPCPTCETYKVLDTNAPHEWEWTGPDGREYQIYDFPFSDPDGSPLILEMGVDVTVLKEKEAQISQMAAALRRSYDELEARVQDRTQELVQSNAALQNEIAERLWSEKKLKESEERYRLLVYLSPDAIAVYSQGRLAFINHAGAKLFGAKRYQELIGKPGLDIVHPDHREAVEHQLRRLTAEGGRTKLQEIKILRLDCREVDVEAAAVGITYQGQPAVQVVMRDITARKRAEQELAHQASFPRLNPNPVLEADLSGNITYANAASLNALKKLGLENQTRAFLPPDLDDMMKAAAEKGEMVFPREVEINGVVFGETLSFPREFPVIRIYAKDITKQKQAERERREFLEKLKASEEELQATVEELQVQAEELETQAEELLASNQNLNEAHAALRESQKDLNRAQAVAHTGSWRLEVRQNELVWSDETYRIFGIPQGTPLTYEAFLAAVHPQDREHVDQKWIAALTGEPYDLEHRIIVGDKVKWVRERAELEFDPQGQLLGGFGTVQDITARKQAEQTIKASRDFLEIANRHTRTAPLLRDFVAEIKKFSGCEAVGIRVLDEAGNIPYLAYDGFFREFYEVESPLNIKSDRCMCINVIKGTTDPQRSFYTGGGSFYMNGTTRFLATVSQKAKGKTRNMCNIVGYESVALVPIRLGNQTLGLIHLADPREDMVPLSLVELLERIGLQMGQAINRTRAEEALQESEERYRSLFQNNQAVKLLIDPETAEIVDSNPAACTFYGYSQKELTAKKITDINIAPREGVFQEMQRVTAGDESHFYFQHRLANGDVRDVEVYSSPLQVRGRTLLYSIIYDNTARKEAEEILRTSKDFLEIANRHTQMAPLLQDYAAAVQEHTGCEAVAIRILDEQGNIPYEAFTGFSQEFIDAESPLCVTTDRCLCINVVTGATDPNLPCYTSSSSCYINRFSHLLATTPPDRLGETRNVCHHFGYESVALIPIVFGGQILGLIHLADHRENMTPLSLVERLERIGEQLGTAINRVRAEEGLRLALADARQRQAEVAALLKASRAVLEVRTFPEISRSIYDSCKELVGASAGYIALLSQDGQENEVLFLDTGGMRCAVDRSLPMPVRGLREKAYRTCSTVYDNDFSGSNYAAFLPAGHVGLDSVLFSPLVVKGRAVGLLGLGNKPGGYTENDARLAAGFGELAAMALANKQAEEERERLIRELETERARLQAIIESAPEAIVVVDHEGRLLLTNPAADRLYSHPEGWVKDAPRCALFQFWHADGTTCVPGNQPLHRSAKEGETHRNVEMVLAWPDGPRLDLLVNTAPIRDQQGRSSGAVGLFLDITERKRTEEKIRKLNEELGVRIREVSERTLQLEAANKELEAFSYSVSHDLRTPLRAIEGFARMLIDDHAPQLNQEGLRLLNVIRGNTRIMGDLIDDLLALSRLGRREIRSQKLDLEALVTSVFRELQAQAPERRLELVLNLLPPVFGDRTLINQVLANLLGNAVKFTKPRKKGIIEVGGWTAGKENIYFVKDNGVGFDMRYVDKIFGVFQRLHRREDFEGTGVGLAIVQRIISRHGGRVWATGKVEGGADFYFTLPVKVEEKGEAH